MGINSTIQSLDRGMAILNLLSDHDTMTASAIAEHLGIHQSSASRLLNSLVQAGLVYKPGFKSFALDYGVLLFAGKTLQRFPLVSKATVVCNRVTAEHHYDATVATMFHERLIYLTTSRNNAALTLIDDPSFPIHLSSVGGMLAYRQGKDMAMKIFQKSITRFGLEGCPETIYNNVAANIAKHGFLYVLNANNNKFNAAKDFTFMGRPACLAIYSETLFAEADTVAPILTDAIKDILK